MALTEKTIEIIKSSTPVIEEKITDLANILYPIIFRRYPGLAIFFNQAHMQNGTQPRAFASSILEYAKAIDNLEAIEPLINDIADKHASLNIKPIQYSIVTSCMLEAIEKILGEISTSDVMNAWDEAIDNFANIIMEAERKKYDETLAKEGGWKGYKSFVVTDKVNESMLITSFYLEPADGKGVVSCRAGQYISIMLDLPEEGTVFRNYSLSCNPNKKYFRISVKREENGLVSNYLHDTIGEGDKIKVNPPYGHLYLRETDKPAVLISGGVGITPMMSILQKAAKQQLSRQVYFLHGTPNRKTHAFKKDVIALTSDHDNFMHRFFYSRNSVTSADTQGGRINIESVKEIIDHNKESEFYLCGPAQMMKDLYHGLREWGVTPDNIIYEYFGPKRDITG